MRHAEAEPAPPGHNDFERSLTPQGVLDARAMGGFVKHHCPRLALVLCSSAKRARETAFNLLEGFRPTPPRLELVPALYLAEAEQVLAQISSHSPRPLLVIGHNPGLEELVHGLLAPSDHDGFIGLSTAALVGLSLTPEEEALMQPGRSRIQLQMRPRQLREDTR